MCVSVVAKQKGLDCFIAGAVGVPFSVQINGKEIRPRYVGRGPMASTAEGTSHDHTEGQRKLIEEAFNN